MGHLVGTYKHVGTPEYELKRLLIALRQVNEISVVEMAKYCKVSKATLADYENDTKINPYFTSKYIEVLEEYVSCGTKRKMSFAEALMIYKNQKELHRYSISYKLALFGNIFYHSTYVDLKAYKPDMLFEGNQLVKKKNETIEDTETVEFKDVSEESVWNKTKYQVAFHALKVLREMLGFNIVSVGKEIGVSEKLLRIFETKVEIYYGKRDLKTVVKDYAAFLDNVLKEQNVTTKVYDVICYLNAHGYNMEQSLKMTQVLLKKLYE